MAAAVDRTQLASELRVVLGRLIRRLRVEHRFPMTHGAVLGRLDREGPQSIGEIAQGERVRPQSMSQTLGELEADGLIARRPDERDGRRTMIELTPQGLEALLADRAVRDGWLARAIEEGFTEDEQLVLQHAVELLARLSEM